MNAALSRPVYWLLHLWVLAYCAVLSGAFVLQFAMGELPCPLCMLQRYGMLLSTLGPVWIILQANSGTLTPQRYQQGLGLAALGAVLGAAVSVRQILLHIMPGDVGYGSAMLGLHLYSWALVTFIIVLATTAILAVMAPATIISPGANPSAKPTAPASSAVIGLFLLILAANAVMIVFLEGAAWVLPDNPTDYHLLQQLHG